MKLTKRKFNPTTPDFHASAKRLALKDKEIRAEYEAFRIQYDLMDKLRKKRAKQSVTQSDIAHNMNTRKTAISRLESPDTKSSPSLLTLCRYAIALGFTLNISLKPLPYKK